MDVNRALRVDVAALRARAKAGESFEFLFFWGHTAQAGRPVGKECLSQWYPARIDVGGVSFASAEHFMMSEKARLMGNMETCRAIQGATTPAEAKQLGRTVRGFNAERWAAHRFNAVVAGNVAKFAQHAALKAFLLGTGDAIPVEASPRDRIWGIGMGAAAAAVAGPGGWRGQNLLGFALVEARARLRCA